MKNGREQKRVATNKIFSPQMIYCGANKEKQSSTYEHIWKSLATKALLDIVGSQFQCDENFRRLFSFIPAFTT